MKIKLLIYSTLMFFFIIIFLFEHFWVKEILQKFQSPINTFINWKLVLESRW